MSDNVKLIEQHTPDRPRGGRAVSRLLASFTAFVVMYLGGHLAHALLWGTLS
jgi:hypothetical protein